MKITLDVQNLEQLANICGSLDKHLEVIAKSLDVVINNKGVDFSITGNSSALAAKVLEDLLVLSSKQTIKLHDLEMCIKARTQDNSPNESVNIKTKRKFIHVRSLNQQLYVKAIQDQDCVFGIGPAGTGKTYLAVARAVEALESSDVRRIVLVRPAVEAGEKLGFLPGDLTEKIDPYLRPIYDALYEMMGFDKVTKL
ncbi:MAG TPA: phosphate starvation-inducible protein PhoH, partial [Candidatus Thioglobus sp.]|nr:phosphate starvation-inducible protein PhoH [Candidatus Thioglobus sp.]